MLPVPVPKKGLAEISCIASSFSLFLTTRPPPSDRELIDNRNLSGIKSEVTKNTIIVSNYFLRQTAMFHSQLSLSLF